MRILALLLVLISTPAWAATYFIDPTCEFNGNGTGGAGACATSAGGAGAYNTGASWFNGVGNTTYLKRGTTITNLPTVISSATQTFAAYGNPALDCPILSKSNTTFTISISAADVTFEDICLTGNQSSAIISTAAARTTLRRIRAYGNYGAGVGVRFNTGSSDGKLIDSEVSEITDDGVGISAAATGTFELTRVRCNRVDLAGGSGDCVQVYDGAVSNLIVSGGVYTKETDFKQAIRYSGSGFVLIKDRPEITVGGASQAISVDGSGPFTLTSVHARGKTGAPLIFTHTSGDTYISGALLEGGSYGVWESHATGVAFVSNSTIRGQDTAAVYHTTDGAGGTLTVQNTYMDAVENIYDAHASATTVANNNRYGPRLGTFRLNGALQSTLAAWQAASSQDANSQTITDPGWAGGLNPVDVQGYRLTGGSVLKCAGTRAVGFMTDLFGRGVEPNCYPVGATVYGRGDARTTALPARR